jgi:serine/threonine protein phosphatase PrpC
MARTPVSDSAGLRDLLIHLDGVIRAERAADDESETTAVAVLFLPDRIAWANVGDSVLFLAVQGRPLERVTPDAFDFLGGYAPIEERQTGSAAGAIVEFGAVALPPGAVALMASDGLDPAYSGMSEARLCELLTAPEPLETRVARIMSEAGSSNHGGGRDNLTVVAMMSDTSSA